MKITKENHKSLIGSIVVFNKEINDLGTFFEMGMKAKITNISNVDYEKTIEYI